MALLEFVPHTTNPGKAMQTTLNTLLTFTFFAPMALMVATNLLTHRTHGPSLPAGPRRASLVPLPPARSTVPVANDTRYLEAA